VNNETAMVKSIKNITAFFVLVFIFSLPFYILASLVPGEMAMFIGLTLALAPFSAALILVFWENRSFGTKRLLKRSFDYKRVTIKSWYFPIFFLFPILFLLALGLMIFMGAPLPDPIAPVLAAPVAFLAFFLFALFEELGWMGYAFDPMQERWHALIASLILGVIWAAWHIPLYVFAGLDPLWIAGQLISLIGIRTLIVWIYNNTGKSVFAAILFHAVYNVCTIMITSFYTSLGHLFTSIFIIITAVIVVFLWGPETLAQYRLSKVE